MDVPIYEQSLIGNNNSGPNLELLAAGEETRILRREREREQLLSEDGSYLEVHDTN